MYMICLFLFHVYTSKQTQLKTLATPHLFWAIDTSELQ